MNEYNLKLIQIKIQIYQIWICLFGFWIRLDWTKGDREPLVEVYALLCATLVNCAFIYLFSPIHAFLFYARLGRRSCKKATRNKTELLNKCIKQSPSLTPVIHSFTFMLLEPRAEGLFDFTEMIGSYPSLTKQYYWHKSDDRSWMW